MAGETKVGNTNRFRVEYLQRITFYAVTRSFETTDLLHHGRLEIARNKHVAKVVLRVEVVDRDPLDVGDFLVVGQSQRKVLVEVTLQDVCAVGVIIVDKSLEDQCN